MRTIVTALAGLLSLAGAIGAVVAAGSGPTDPQIPAVVVTANQVDIDAAKAHDVQVRPAEHLANADPWCAASAA